MISISSRVGKILMDEVDFERLKQIQAGKVKLIYHKCWGRMGSTGRYRIRIKLEGKNIALHRWIMDCPKGFEVDHINGNALDNRRVNLRIVTHHQNMMGFQSKPRNAHSKYRGVSWERNQKLWVAYIQFQGKHINLGRFKDEIEAAKVRDAKAIELFGEYAHLNFPN